MPPSKQRRIRALHAAGWTRQNIAALVSVSRADVTAVLNGEDSAAAVAMRREERERKRVEQSTAALRELNTGHYVRCAGCGGRVLLPCRTCRLRKRRGW